MLTVRGQSPAEFHRNLAAVKGLLDQAAPPQAPAVAPSQGPPQPGWCAIHDCAMTEQEKQGQRWWSHKTDQGWCKGRRGR